MDGWGPYVKGRDRYGRLWVRKRNDRAGRCVQQPAGYRAFLPAPLPPNPPLCMDDLQAPLAEASHALGRLDGAVLTLLNPDLFVLMHVLKEAVLFSQIEGTQSSLQELLEAETRIFSLDRPPTCAKSSTMFRR